MTLHRFLFTFVSAGNLFKRRGCWLLSKATGAVMFCPSSCCRCNTIKAPVLYNFFPPQTLPSSITFWSIFQSPLCVTNQTRPSHYHFRHKDSVPWVERELTWANMSESFTSSSLLVCSSLIPPSPCLFAIYLSMYLSIYLSIYPSILKFILFDPPHLCCTPVHGVLLP